MTDPFVLFESLRAGDVHAVRRAVEADPSLANARDEHGVSLLMLAMYHRHQDLAQEIAGRVDQLDAFEVAAMGRLGDLAALIGHAPSALTRRSTDGFTLLHLAAFFGQPEVVVWLLRQGAPVDAIAGNESLVRPLHSSVAAGSLRVTELLLRAGADPSAPQRGGWTALHGAARRGDADLVGILLEHGADRDATSDDGKSALDLAREHGHREVVARLGAGS